MVDYDVLIVGSGLAGLTAGLFAARHGLSTLVLEANIPGGHLTNIEKIEDFPGFLEGIAGYNLCPAVQRQAAEVGAEFQRGEVERLEPRDRLWAVSTAEETYHAKAVIVATGSRLKDLGIPGEGELRGRGVSHCSSCDGPLYSDQVVGVVGGGDSALQEALTLAGYAARIVLFHHEAKFSAQNVYQQRVLNHSKIAVYFDTTVEEILGDSVVKGVRIRSLKTGEITLIDLAGVFIYIGLQPATKFLQSILRLSDTGHVPTDVLMRTERAGIYAVGDIRQDAAAQAITSAGDGAAAAIAAYRYIKGNFG
ncbi:MAG TPA: FAD-dependent oxidoreductase [Candidatus Acidoferrales bacterium]|nr:FAD-dependent oxidoreductase [Candidatus Acidoferrales bacterium]